MAGEFRVCMRVYSAHEQVIVNSEVWIAEMWLHRLNPNQPRDDRGDAYQPTSGAYHKDYEFRWDRERNLGQTFQTEEAGCTSDIYVFIPGIVFEEVPGVVFKEGLAYVVQTDNVTSSYAPTIPPGVLADYEKLCAKLVSIEHTHPTVPVISDSRRPPHR